MGTRNLTMVISNGKAVIAQYGQWDGHPDGQGATALRFLKECDMNKFRQTLDRCRFIDETKEAEIKDFLNSIGATDGWLTMEQSAEYHRRYPFLTRNNGANILNLLYGDQTDDVLWITDSSEFAADSLFCEWAYVIDLDNETFEVFEGFNKSPLNNEERFYYLQEQNKHYSERRGDDEQYYPIKHVKTYKLSELPDVKTFIEEVDKLTEEQEA